MNSYRYLPLFCARGLFFVSLSRRQVSHGRGSSRGAGRTGPPAAVASHQIEGGKSALNLSRPACRSLCPSRGESLFGSNLLHEPSHPACHVSQWKLTERELTHIESVFAMFDVPARGAIDRRTFPFALRRLRFVDKSKRHGEWASDVVVREVMRGEYPRFARGRARSDVHAAARLMPNHQLRVLARACLTDISPYRSTAVAGESELSYLAFLDAVGRAKFTIIQEAERSVFNMFGPTEEEAAAARAKAEDEREHSFLTIVGVLTKKVGIIFPGFLPPCCLGSLSMPLNLLRLTNLPDFLALRLVTQRPVSRLHGASASWLLLWLSNEPTRSTADSCRSTRTRLGPWRS